jgi:hypothetical protein
MKIRNPTRALTRTYLKTQKYANGTKKYVASIIIPSTNDQFSCTRKNLSAAVQCLKTKAGIKS